MAYNKLILRNNETCRGGHKTWLTNWNELSEATVPHQTSAFQHGRLGLKAQLTLVIVREGFTRNVMGK